MASQGGVQGEGVVTNPVFEKSKTTSWRIIEHISYIFNKKTQKCHILIYFWILRIGKAKKNTEKNGLQNCRPLLKISGHALNTGYQVI